MKPSRLLLLLLGVSCNKVPIYSVEAGFTRADVSWFNEEDTMFVFYEVEAEQGLGDPSIIELTYTTDNLRLPWTPLTEFDPIHTHLDVDCGPNKLCGSWSLHVPDEPRDVQLRLRYHRDGELALDAETVFNVVGPGPAHSHRSLLIYGVYNETNDHVEWRSRNQFPTLRNQQATALGLRREFLVEEPRFGTLNGQSSENPYAYGASCSATFTPTGLTRIHTDQRAVYHPMILPIEAQDSSALCAQSTVTDAIGTFTTTAFARKNPEIRSAFPILRSPIRDATAIKFFLKPCDRVISVEHEGMQRQRLQMESVPPTCIDDWDRPEFVNELVVLFRDAIEAERVAGRDMVLMIGLHTDEAGVPDAIEEVLAQLTPNERHRSTPRLAGAFIFGSTNRRLQTPGLKNSSLWCPAEFSLTEPPDPASINCLPIPDLPLPDLGPFDFGVTPILPSRTDYLAFIRDFSADQAGFVTDLSLRVPEFAATSDHIDLGDFGVVTYLNGEVIGADGDDAFSYCTPEEIQPFTFRSPQMGDLGFLLSLVGDCQNGILSQDICLGATVGAVPIQYLPVWHNLFQQQSYEVGLYWSFPFLVHLDYEGFFAGSISAFGFSVPFGVSAHQQSDLGAAQWLKEEFPIDPALTHCRRFCDHPTFDSAGVYHVTDSFRQTYAQSCYLPVFPVAGGSGFPLDP